MGRILNIGSRGGMVPGSSAAALQSVRIPHSASTLAAAIAKMDEMNRGEVVFP
jgi:hypothetical protein